MRSPSAQLRVSCGVVWRRVVMAEVEGSGLCSIFKRFSADDDAGLQLTQVKTSAARTIKSRLTAQYPYLLEGGLIDVLIPKKVPVVVAKCPNHVQVIVVAGVPRFFSVRDKLYFPTLRTLHEYPEMMTRLRVDEPAIRFVLKGANVMVRPGACPHLSLSLSHSLTHSLTHIHSHSL